jgi:hypothetical protein
MIQDRCQFDSFLGMGAGTARKPFKFYVIKLGSFVKRHLSKRQFEAANKIYLFILGAFSKKSSFSGRQKNNIKTNKNVSGINKPLKAGDMIRVRSLEEIEATLDEKGKTKGCTFIKAQQKYCGSVQRVFKSLERFVDERDFNVKKCKGMVLLEGVMCDGSDTFGRCDRSCLIFWREEWLEML